MFEFDYDKNPMTLRQELIKFLPSYVGSKSYWVSDLSSRLLGKNIAELFAGSAVISANLAKKAYLNDLDSKIFKILSEFLQLEEIGSFTQEDYFKFRSYPDWWKYSFYFQKMSFSGVFRYSKNGYNVPVKKNIKSIEILPELILAKKRMVELSPTITNLSYSEVDLTKLAGWAIILDPPYQGSQASYNITFDYKQYWEFVKEVRKYADPLILFDREKNLLENYPKESKGMKLRKMRVNGKRAGDIEAMLILENKK